MGDGDGLSTPSKILIVVLSIVLILAIVLPAVLVPRPVPCDDIRYEPGYFSKVFGLCFPSSNVNVSVDHIGSGQLYVGAGGKKMIVTVGSQIIDPTMAYEPVDASKCTDLGVWMNPAFNCNVTSWNVSYPSSFSSSSSAAVLVPWKISNPSNCDASKYQINGTIVAVDQTRLGFSIREVFPPAFCLGVTQPVTVEGNGMLFSTYAGYASTATAASGSQIDPIIQSSAAQTSSPQVLLDGSIIGSSTNSLCTTLISGKVSSCTATSITLASSAVAKNSQVSLKNAEPCASQISSSVAFTYVDGSKVNVTGASPNQGCINTKSHIVNVTGNDFLVYYSAAHGFTYPEVKFGAKVATIISSSGCVSVGSFLGQVQKCTQLQVYAPLTNSSGPISISVTQPIGCSSLSTSKAGLFSYVPSDVFVIYADPPFIYNGVPFLVQVFTSGLSANTKAVFLLNSTLDRILNLTISYGASFNKFKVLIPQNQVPVGKYSLEVQGVLCNGILENAIEVKSPTLTVSKVTPDHIWSNRDSLVSIAGIGFADPPSVYVTSGSAATAALAVNFETSIRITAVIPSLTRSLPVGNYTLVVINPQGEVGVLQAPLKLVIQANEPLTVTSISTEYLNKGTDTIATIRGTNFQAPVTVRRRCFDINKVAVALTPSVDTTVQSVTSTSISVTFLTISGYTPAPPGDYAYCDIIVTNGDEAVYEFSGLTQGTNAANIAGWRASSNEMNVARLGFGFSGSKIPGSQDRLIYAVAGTNTTSVYDSVESSIATSNGILGNWALDRQNLPVKRQYSCAAALGSFLYVVGGADENGLSSRSVYRAQILDALAVPVVSAVDITLDTNTPNVTTFPAGFFYYQVAATFDASYTRNPLGETLPSEFTVLRLPLLTFPLGVKITWTQVPQATGYRLYRNKAVGGKVMELLTTTTGIGSTTFTDLFNTTSSATTPEKRGNLGKWHTIASMTVPRWRHGCSFVPKPQNMGDPTTWYLYAAGGLTTTTALASMEFIQIDIVAKTNQYDSTNQNFGTWASTTALSFGRFNIQMRYGTDRIFSSQPNGTTRVWVGGGSVDGNNLNTGPTGQNVRFDTFKIMATGGASGLVQISKPKSNFGYCLLSGGDKLRDFGGGSSAECAKGNGGQPVADGSFSSWNAEGGANLISCRRYMGCDRVGSFAFVCGGQDSTTTTNVRKTCESTFL